jgi:hypothetical protein
MLQGILKDLLSRHKFNTPLNGTPKSFFKALFIDTCLWAAPRRISQSRTVLNGLKPQECERNVGQRLHIPYIPKKDVIQEALDTNANALKLILPHKVEL